MEILSPELFKRQENETNTLLDKEATFTQFWQQDLHMKEEVIFSASSLNNDFIITSVLYMYMYFTNTLIPYTYRYVLLIYTYS